MSWNPTVFGLALDVVGFILVFQFGGFDFGTNRLVWKDQSKFVKPLRILGAILVISGFAFQIFGATGA